MTNTDAKHESLQQILERLSRVVVAYSGGVDSTFLLKVAIQTLGSDNVLACIGVSPSLARSQHERAVRCARDMGAHLREVDVHEILDGKYSANSPDRCFHCKSHLYQALWKVARDDGFDAVVCGSNFDDQDDFRPGNRAARRLGVACPLMEARMTKQDIRMLSRRLMLPTADIPASPCLASRLSYGLQITRERLGQVEQAEEWLRELGFRECRVRHHDTMARIEVRCQDFPRLFSEPIRSQIVARVIDLGFTYVTVDLAGFRSGSLNDVLSEAEKQANR